MRYRANLGKGLILHFKIVKDDVRVLNNQPFYFIISAIEHTLWGFKPVVWSADSAFEHQFFNSISNAENALARYFSDRDIILEKGVELKV